jgi:hypothetical protein
MTQRNTAATNGSRLSHAEFIRCGIGLRLLGEIDDIETNVYALD